MPRPSQTEETVNPMSATALQNADTPRRLPRWTNNLLVVAIGAALALLALEFLPRPLPSLPTASHGGVAAGDAGETPDTLALGRTIAETHLFGDATAVPPPPPPEKIEAPVEDTRLNLQLAGVFAADPQSQAIAIISSGQAEQNAYGIGDKIAEGTTLKAVYTDHVIIDNRGRDERLSLPDTVQPVAMRPVESASVARASTVPAGANEDFSQPVELPSNPGELRDTLARNPSMLGRVVAAEPYQENGKLVGYRITPKQNPEILEAQGIVAGDVITRVNNIQLNSQKQGIRALRNAVKAQNLEVVVLRDGVEVPISISLAR